MRRKLRLEVVSSVPVALIPTTPLGEFITNYVFFNFVFTHPDGYAERPRVALATLVPSATARCLNVLPALLEGLRGTIIIICQVIE